VKLWEVFRYNTATQLRRFTTLIYGAALAGATVLGASTFFDDVRRDAILLNAPLVTAACLIVVSMLGLLVTAALTGEAATRDTRARMEALLYTTPLPKLSYLGGRFLSAFASGALLLAVVPLLLAMWTFFPIGEAAVFGPFRLAPYLRAFALIGLPNAFVATALLFSLVVVTRRPMAAYLGGAALFFNSVIQEGIVAGVLGKWALAKQLDPFAFLIVAAHWRSHSASQRNALQVELEGALLANRMLWLSIAIVALTLAYLRFRMEHHTAAAWPWQRRAAAARSDAETKPWAVAVTPSSVHATFDRTARVRQVVAIAFDSWREMIASRVALLIPAVAFLAFNLGLELLEFGLGTPSRFSTGRLALLYGKFNVTGIGVGALIAYFAGHLVWRDRDARADDIVDVTPVPVAVTFAGKFAGLALLVITVQTVLIATGILTQTTAGSSEVDLWLWVRVLLGVKLVDYLLFAALVMAVHVIVNHKYLGMALAFALWIFPEYAGDLGISHHLLIYGSDPGLRYSEFNGFAASAWPWVWFKLYWTGWALLFLLLTQLFWVQGRDARRIVVARQRFTFAPATVAVIALALIAGAGGFVFYNTNVLNQYVRDEDLERQSAEYERRYGKYDGLAQPVLTATKLHVELYPSQRGADIRGTYTLTNRTERAIDAIHLVTRTTGPTSDVTLDRPARATLVDEALGYRIYTLARALVPGESLRMHFAVPLATKGFTNNGVNPALASNGTLLENRPDSGGRTWLPQVGYRRGVELDNAYDRSRYGLRPRPAAMPLTDVAARTDQRGIEGIRLETVIGTEPDQLAIAPGALRRSWTERGRRYFHYVTDAPIRNGFPILSARYAVHRSRWNGIDIEVVHHPKHAWNAQRFERSARASLEYYSKAFGPYPHRQLRLVEFPITGGNRLTGHPGTVIWSEAIAFAEPENDPREIDFPFAVVAHEVAHQWWGNIVVPARVEGAAFMSESLSWYSAMGVVEKTFGTAHRERLLDVMRESYLTPHETPNVPLLRANDWLGVYRTGALAMQALRDEIGEQRVNGALRRVADAHRAGQPPFATSLDLYRELRAVTPPEAQTLLKDLLEEITFWDLRLKSLDVQRAGPAWRVTLGIEAHKVKVDGGGRESRAPLDQWIEIGLFDAKGEALYRQKYRIRSGGQTITLSVASAPARAAIDPGNRLLDRKREDNVRDVAGE
jgi:ABC-2 type transport system permease protein